MHSLMNAIYLLSSAIAMFSTRAPATLKAYIDTTIDIRHSLNSVLWQPSVNMGLFSLSFSIASCWDYIHADF